MRVSFNWLQEYFTTPLPSPTELAALITKHSFEVESVMEVEGDVVIDIDVLPNRTHDCLSHDGIAREIGVLLKRPMIERPTKVWDDYSIEGPKVNIESDGGCLRYIGRRIDGLSVGPAPDWLQHRLKILEQRSINILVDIANYCMLETGQPLHIFDADKVNGSLCVRYARKGEFIVTLDDEELELDESCLLIADEDGPLAIAGIKGGKKAAVDESTKNILIEAANFEAGLIRKVSRHLGIRTEASKRFENHLSVIYAKLGIDRVTDLILDLVNSQAKVSELTDIPVIENQANQIKFTASDVEKFLGTPVNDSLIKTTLEQLNFLFTQTDDVFTVMPPVERLDLALPVDIYEEIGRLIGFDQIVGKLLPTVVATESDHLVDNLWRLKKILLDFGFSEAYGYSFSKKGEIKLANPLAKDRPYLRLNLHKELTTKLVDNLKHVLFDHEPVTLFEIGTVFPAPNLEQMHVSFGLAYKKSKLLNTNNVLENVLTEIKQMWQTNDLVVQEIKEENVWLVEFDLSLLPSINHQFDLNAYVHFDRRFKEVSAFPRIIRDIALFVPQNISPDLVSTKIRDLGTELLVTEPVLFDDFVKDNRRSLAFRLVFQSYERTLSDDEVNQIMNQMSDSLEKEIDWTVRR